MTGFFALGWPSFQGRTTNPGAPTVRIWLQQAVLILALFWPAGAAEAQGSPSELQLVFEPSLDSGDNSLLAVEALVSAENAADAEDYEIGEGLDVFLRERRRDDRTSRRFSAISPLSGYAAGRSPDGLFLSPFIGTRAPRPDQNREHVSHYSSAGPYDNYYAGVAGLGILLDRGVWASFAYGTGDELPGLTYESDIEGVAFDESERLLFGLHIYY